MAAPDDLVWRAPTPADAEAIGRMHHQAWVDAYADLLPDDWFEHWTVDVAIATWRRILAAPGPGGPRADRRLRRDRRRGRVGRRRAVAARRRGRAGRDRELWGLYVASGHHGSGLARALAEQALGDGPAELWVFDGNPRAEAFYRKLGFERDGVEAPHRETGLHGIRMVRGR